MIRSLLLCLCFLLLSSTVQAQTRGLTSEGTDFYLGLVPSSNRCPAIRPYIYIYALISSYYDNTVEVRFFDQSGKEPYGGSYELRGKHSIQIPLSENAMRPTAEGEYAEYKACHIFSKNPVSVQYYSTGPTAGTEFSVLPTQALGRRYVVAAHPSNTGAGAGGKGPGCDGYYLDSASSVFMIVAAHDSTNVTITPNGTTYRLNRIGVTTGAGADASLHPFNVLLNRGQVYLVKSQNDRDSVDESGSRIDADKTVAVIAGNEAALVNLLLPVITTDPPSPSRNLMLQQMIPSEYLAAKDHLSMPFIDGLPLSDSGAGEYYRLFTSGLSASSATVQLDSSSDVYDLTAFGLGPIVQHVNSGVNISSNDNTPILVEEYDYRKRGTTIQSAPTMMNVLAKSQWIDHTVFMIPGDLQPEHSRHFLNVIARTDQFSKIKVSKNAGPTSPLSALATLRPDAHWASHPELIGKRFEMSPGTYALDADSTFAAYAYGMLGVETFNSPSDNDDDDFNFEYATPVGERFLLSIPTKIGVTVAKDSCNGWNLAVTEQDSAKMGLATIELLTDPDSIYSRPARVSQNATVTRLDVSGMSRATVQVSAIDPLLDAFAAVRILTRTGKDTVIELRQAGLHLSDSSSQFSLVAQVGVDSCAMFVVRNDTSKFARSYRFTSSYIIGDSSVRVTSTQPALPRTLGRGDSIRVFFCYRPEDTPGIVTTLVLGGDCLDIKVPVKARGVTPIIQANDKDFHAVPQYQTKCQFLHLMNTGTSTLVIDSAVVFGSPAFTATGMNTFPVSITPGGAIDLTVCYRPTGIGYDTARILWLTNIHGRFEHQLKDYSFVVGHSTPSAVTTLKDQESLKISPNPVRGNILRIEGRALDQRSRVEIYDLLGAKLLTINHASGEQNEEMPVGSLSGGTYYLRIVIGDEVITRKFIIER